MLAPESCELVFTDRVVICYNLSIKDAKYLKSQGVWSGVQEIREVSKPYRKPQAISIVPEKRPVIDRQYFDLGLGFRKVVHSASFYDLHTLDIDKRPKLPDGISYGDEAQRFGRSDYADGNGGVTK